MSRKRIVLNVKGVPTRYTLAKDLGETLMIVREGSFNNKTETVTKEYYNDNFLRVIKKKRYDKK